MPTGSFPSRSCASRSGRSSSSAMQRWRVRSKPYARRLGAAREVEPHYNALRALYALAREVVQRYGGTLQPVVGAQIMAIFGAPLAQEDHARRAVLAALDLQQRQRQHPTLHPPALDKGLA